MIYLEKKYIADYQRRFKDGYLLTGDDIDEVMQILSEFIEDEAEAMIKKEPYATISYKRMIDCARELRWQAYSTNWEDIGNDG